MITKRGTNIIHKLFIAFICAASASLLHADEMNDLMSTLIQASPEVKAKAQAYKHPSKKVVSSEKASPSAKSSVGVPNIQIPDSEVLEACAKFPKLFVGKYIYGEVFFGDIVNFSGESNTSICFYAKNLRGFWLDTQDDKIIEKFKSYKHGDKFFISRECPLRITEKSGFNYFVRLPFEAPCPN
jgi:hypothetical protein